MANGGEKAVVKGRPLNPTPEQGGAVDLARDDVALVRKIVAKSKNSYRLAPGGLVQGGQLYTDRNYKFQTLPAALQGLDLIQTANDDDRAGGRLANVRSDCAIASHGGRRPTTHNTARLDPSAIQED